MLPFSSQITAFEKTFQEELALVKNFEELELFRIKYLSRQGLLQGLVQQLKELPLEEKKSVGPLVNNLKSSLQEAYDLKEVAIASQKRALEELKLKNFDVTAYKPVTFQGSLHPYTHITERVEDIFISMGFDVVDGPEVEHEYNNFEALNIPADHPARDMQDTFWLNFPSTVLRTHTSSVWTHIMKARKPPISIVVPGRAYRNEATDASHDFMFMQLEGLYIDKDVSLAHLIATLELFLQTLFERKDLTIQIRPSYFPFVEPGVEFDMSCPFCTTGCSICKKSRWIEIGGAGLAHPHVLQACSLDPQIYSGFAFGLGLTRLVMLKYGITDIRLLHSNKLGFLTQF
jgi:phenylalanyl-tRNA synthetase alpha chain